MDRVSNRMGRDSLSQNKAIKRPPEQLILGTRNFHEKRLERTRKSLINTVTMSSSSAIATVTTTVFEAGKYTTVLQKVESRTTCCTAKTSPPLPVPPPKPLLIVMPCEAGEFPLLVFLHGYLLYNSFYSQLLQHIASHGFIVIAPQVHITLSS